MSLNWNLNAIANRETVCWDAGHMKSETEVLIYATMFVGIPEITTKNALSFFARLSLFERVGGSLLLGRSMTFAAVQAHIGMKTNASKMSEAQFAKVILSRWNREDTMQAATKGGAA